MSSPSLHAARTVKCATAALLVAIAALAAPGCAPDPEAKTCASGVYCPAGTKCAANQAVCLLDDCGDGELQPGEACDDGDVLDGPVVSSGTCNHDCTSDERCGNGITDEAMGEICDDAHAPGGCSDDCRSTGNCGNGVVDALEQCDPGVGRTESETCNSDCTVMRHGDGKVNATAGEQCDRDGTGLSVGANCQWATCNWDCTLSRHGDGIVNPLHLVDGVHGEQCDGGDGSPGATCESANCDVDCTWPECGDGTVNTRAREECDDGNRIDEDGCLNDCRFNTCGDGHLNPGAEACDDGNGITETDCLYGTMSCQACNATCTGEISPEPHYCGDGTVDSGLLGVDGRYHSETCDNVYSFACGTCSLTTCLSVSLARATGTITVASTPTNVQDGDTVVLDDGANTLTLELDRSGSCATPGSTCVVIPPGSTSAEIATIIRDAITAVHDGNGIDIAASAFDRVVALEHDWNGTIGNVPIVATSPLGGVVVSGMNGGVGCPLNSRCSRDSDCASTHCRSGFCR